jgi:hypothetical protein
MKADRGSTIPVAPGFGPSLGRIAAREILFPIARSCGMLNVRFFEIHTAPPLGSRPP